MKRIVREINRATTSVDYDQGGVKKIRISDNLTSLDVVGSQENAILSSLKSVTVGGQVQELAPSCFAGCSNLMNVVLPEGCSDLGDYAFAGCSSLQSINCLNGQMTQSLANIGSHCFDGCDSLVDIQINLGRSNRLTMIGEYAFANCRNLRSVEWTLAPFIASHMFSGCSSLTALNFRNPTTNYVYPYGFAEIPSILSIQIPRTTWFLNDNMFEGCSKLSSVEIQDGTNAETSSVLNQVGEWVFNGCSSLHEITLPRSITSFSQIDDNFLAGSSISAVKFNGIDIQLFKDKQVLTREYKLGTWYTWKKDTKDSLKDLVRTMLDEAVPMVIVVGGKASDDAQKKFQSRVLEKFTPDPNYMYLSVDPSANDKINEIASALGAEDKYITFVMDSNKKFVTKVGKYKEKTYKSHKVPHVLAVWSGLKGKTAVDPSDSSNRVNLFGNAYLGTATYAKLQQLKDGFTTQYDKTKGANKFLQWHKSLFSGFVPKATSYILTSTGELSLMGRNMGVPYQDKVSLRFYTSDGKSFEVQENGKWTFEPEVRVDRFLKTNFKYGTWYYNASGVKKFADTYHVPVLIEYSSEGCDPCEYFKKHIFRDSSFQEWVSGMKCLFVRVEIKSGEKWDNPAAYPEPYFVDHDWVGEGSVSIPVICWYWKKNDNDPPVKITRTYHFSPGEQEPPFSMQDLMLSTEQIFQEYVPDSVMDKVAVKPAVNESLGVVVSNSYPNRPTNDEFNGKLKPCLSAYDWDYVSNENNPPYTAIYNRLTAAARTYDQDDDTENILKYHDLPKEGGDAWKSFISSCLSSDVYLGEFDSNGVYFPCDTKTKIDSIDQYITIEGTDGVPHTLKPGAVSTGNKVLDADNLQVPDGTYQFYDFDSSNLYRYDQYGYIFKVEDMSAKYVYRFENEYGSELYDRGVQKYSQRVMYEFTDDTPGDEMQRFIDQCEEDGKKIPAIYFVGRGTSGIPVTDSSELKSFMQTTNAYFSRIISQSDTWTANAPRTFSQYTQERRVKFNGSWSGSRSPGTTLPCMYVLKMCSTCYLSKEEIVPELKAWYDISSMDGARLVQILTDLIGK